MYHKSPDRLAETARLATQGWLEKAVIGLNLCPFAKAVHVRGQIRYAVTLATRPVDLLPELRDQLVELTQADPAVIDTTLFIIPCCLADFYEYNQFLSVVDNLLGTMGLDGQIQIASFHPQYQFAGSERDDVENYTNRSPYPILHLLREASVTRAVETFPDTDLIFEKNMATLRKLGHAGWERIQRESQREL